MSKTKIPSLANLPTLGPDDTIGEGDSFIKYDNTLSSDSIFKLLHDEVSWQKMYHAAGEVPRLVAVQGTIDADGSKPVYRHPSDQSPPLLAFTPAVLLVKNAAEAVIGHSLNHVLIQLYRDGKDHITEHSDKTLDIVRGSKIVNASFGARRTMRLRRKRKSSAEPRDPRETQRVHMPHNSLFVLGLATNQSWLHGINADKRLSMDRAPEEMAFDGMRISLTFRHIGTFLDADETHIWGQGARAKSKEDAHAVVAGDDSETERMIYAFGRENHQDEEWDWEEEYGKGFDVLHFRA
ncbi:hypothetical protein BT63DRAFT_430755 [Microthyrium microscopicum]|uniref:Fe2OG dioxygenase domain-containing protein n=1 Tax=Microthyrium microscopicum TaxID=703497 RepID=A0A6A6UQU0_9PEZI|nr:hypothetical protein BT63DRAFT_430755 [Microthyrium microscopicum]